MPYLCGPTKTYMRKIITRLSAIALLVLSTSLIKAQALAGSYTIGISYPTIGAAIAALNTNSISAAVTIEIPAGYTETVSAAGGFSLTCSGTAGTPIVFQKNGAGANPIVVSATGGAGTPGSAVQDGIWRLIGCDYITIDGIDLFDQNTANPSTMEFGYGLFKASATDGCQFNTIKNCTVTLNKVNNATGSGPAVDGSRGIDVVNALTGAHTTAVTVTSANGTHSNNNFYNNLVQNCNIGISMIGYAATTPFTNADQNNNVGGLSAVTGNTIVNYGGGGTANPAAAIRTLAQYNVNVSFNTINNNNGSGVNHGTTLRGIYLNTATSANAAITNNTVTINGGASTSQASAIENVSGSTAAGNTITISNNYIANCTYTSATSGNFYCILNSATPALLNVSSNTITNNSLAGTGTWYGMEVTSPPLVSITNNLISNNIRNVSTSGTSYCMKMTSPSTLTASGNTVELNGFSAVGSTGSVYGFYGLSSSVNVNVINNIIRNLTVAGAGSIYGIREWGVAGIKVFQGNEIYGFTSAAGASMYGINVSTGTISVNTNTIYSLNGIGGTAGSYYGIYISSSTPTTTIFKNKIYDISSSSTNPVLNGININAGVCTIYNNFIGDLRTTAANAAIPLAGINVSGGTVSNLFYNTVYLNGTSSGALFGSAALYASTTPSLNLRNNVLINNSTPNGAGFTAAYRRTGTTLTTYSATSNNNVLYGGTPGPNNLLYYDGTNSVQTLAGYQATVTPRDANSFTENTTFLSTSGPSATFLHVDPSLPSLTESGAVNIAGITDDYDADIRQGNPGYSGSGTAPDIGADEYDQALPSCSTVSGGTISTASFTRCAGQSVTMNVTGFTVGSGITYQWQVATSIAGPYSNVAGGSGATTSTYSTAALSAGTYYYQLVTTCTISSNTATSNIATVLVNPIPTASATSNSPLCSGQTLNLTGGSDVGTNFTWTGPATFSVQNPSIIATASLSGNYTLVVSAAGCNAAPVSVNVTVTSTPSNLTVTPTSAAICAGNSQTITAVGGDVNKTFVFGAQTNTNTAAVASTDYPAPYTVYYGGQRMQMLILASELTASGLSAGPIQSVQFPVISRGANWGSTMNDCKNFQVSIGTTTLTAINSFQTGLTNVLAPINFTPAVGYNNIHSFTTPFIWDGTSNVILETTFSNNLLGATGDAVFQYNTPTTFSSTVVYRADNTAAASMATITTVSYVYQARPDFKLNGTGAASFAWTPSSSLSSATSLTTVATPTASTDYTLTATNSSCSSNAVVSLTVNPLPSVSVAATPTAVCSGNTVSLTASGATTYSWSTGATGSSITDTPTITATYTVDGTNSCGMDTKTISITVNANPTVSAISSSSAVCAGTSATLTAGGANTYSWTSIGIGSTIVVTPTTNTTYTVEGTDSNGCTDMQLVSVNSNSLPVMSANTSASVLCTGSTATLTVSGASTYSWTGVGAGASVVVSPTTTTTYTVEGTDVNGCTDTISIVQTVSLCTGINTLVSVNGVSVYPNPSNGIVTLFVSDASKEMNFEIYDAIGKMIFNKIINSSETQINISELTTGIYSYRLVNSNGSVSQGKLIKQ